MVGVWASGTLSRQKCGCPAGSPGTLSRSSHTQGRLHSASSLLLTRKPEGLNSDRERVGEKDQRFLESRPQQSA